MKTRLMALIIIGVVLFGSFSFVYALMYDCLNPPMWMKTPRSGLNHCWGLFLNGYLPNYSDDRERYENKQFQIIMEKKATLAFDIKLDAYSYSVDQLTVQQGVRTGTSTNEFFIAYAVTTNGTNYFMRTSFESEQSMDTIDVQIFKVISEKCTVHDVLNSSGCDPKYLEKAEKITFEGLDYWRSGEIKNEK